MGQDKKAAARPCGVCGVTFPLVKAGRRKYCGQPCADKAQEAQLKDLGERRRANGLDKPVECAACGTAFPRKSGAEKYCSLACKSRGLALAIERQRERREAAKIERLKKDTQAPVG